MVSTLVPNASWWNVAIGPTVMDARKGKPLSFSEWGLVDEDARMTAGAGGGDSPYFVERMRAWIDSHDVAHEVYFDVNAADGKHRLTDPLFPRAAVRYRTLVGG